MFLLASSSAATSQMLDSSYLFIQYCNVVFLPSSAATSQMLCYFSLFPFQGFFCRCHKSNTTPIIIAIFTCVGLARTVYIHRIWPYFWWFSCQKYRIYTVYLWFWLTLYIRSLAAACLTDGFVCKPCRTCICVCLVQVCVLSTGYLSTLQRRISNAKLRYLPAHM